MNAAEAFGVVLVRYGQSVGVCRDERTVLCRAFLQPILERKGRQTTPTVLGEVCRDRWLYLGDPAVSPQNLGDGYILWKGKKFEVVKAQPIYVGNVLSHWWAVLKARDEA